MNGRLAAELSRRFLAKYVVNHQSNKLHAVRDAFSADLNKEILERLC